MNALENIFYNHDGRLIHKWHHYLEIYDHYFNKYINKNVKILEIGVSQGGSLQMWKKYFGNNVTIYGLDINPQCKSLEEENIHIFIGSQSDRGYLRWLKTQIPKIDILLDDGGHTMKQQIITFEELFDHINDNGIYMCEDCETSYMLEFGGGYRRRGTFIEYSKQLVDKINAWHSCKLSVDEFTKNAKSINFYTGMVVIEKGLIDIPKSVMVGEKSFNVVSDKVTSNNIVMKLCILIDKVLNRLKLPSLFR